MDECIKDGLRTMGAVSIDRINKIKEAHRRYHEARDAYREMAAPVISDMALLPRVYTYMSDFFRERGIGDFAATVYHRKKFLFVALWLFCPRGLAGVYTQAGMRDRLARLLGMKTKTPLSDQFVNLVFEYRTYRDFRRDVDEGLAYVTARLQADGLSGTDVSLSRVPQAGQRQKWSAESYAAPAL